MQAHLARSRVWEEDDEERYELGASRIRRREPVPRPVRYISRGTGREGGGGEEGDLRPRYPSLPKIHVRIHLMLIIWRLRLRQTHKNADDRETELRDCN